MPFIEEGIPPDITESRFIRFKDGKVAYDPSAKSHAGVAYSVDRIDEFRYEWVRDGGTLVRDESGNWVCDLSGDANYLHPDTLEPLDDAGWGRLALRIHQDTAKYLTETTGVIWQASM